MVKLKRLYWCIYAASVATEIIVGCVLTAWPMNSPEYTPGLIVGGIGLFQGLVWILYFLVDLARG